MNPHQSDTEHDATTQRRPPVLGRSGEPERPTDSDGSARVNCTTEECPEEAEFEVIETLFGVDLPGRPVCAMCAYGMGMKDDDDE